MTAEPSVVQLLMLAIGGLVSALIYQTVTKDKLHSEYRTYIQGFLNDNNRALDKLVEELKVLKAVKS